MAVENLASGEKVVVNAEARFPTASLYKLFVMQEVVREISAGELSPDEQLVMPEAFDDDQEPEDGLDPGASASVADALRKMITVSSNTAGVALLQRVGRDRVQTTISASGFGATKLGAVISTAEEAEWGTSFVTTPADVLRVFERLHAGRLVTPTADAQMLALLKQQTRQDRIPALLPPGVDVAHKTGELDGVRHDAGIVYGRTAPYAVIVLSKDVPDEEAVDRAIALIARATLDAFER